MSVITITRRSSADELAAEMDRRGDVIEKLEAERDRLRDALEEIAAPAAYAMPSDDRVEAMRDMAKDALKPVRPAVCETCDGRGVVGGFVNAESGYQTDPCPACQPALSRAQVPS